MRFEINPQMIITQEELLILDNALKLCRDMDAATTCDIEDYEQDKPTGCDVCPFLPKCSKLANECIFTVAHKALKEIIDIAIIK